LWIALTAGISLKMLVQGVFQFEVQLDNWLLAERKKHLMEEEQRFALGS
jgi:RNA polymerase I-specific transcription initiation factor RRN7